MRNQFTLPLTLELTKSKMEKNFHLIIHVLAIGAVLACYLPFALKAALIAVITCNLLYTLRKNNKKPATKLVYPHKKGWQLVENGKPRRIRLSAASVVTHRIIILDLEFLEKATTMPFSYNSIGLNPSRQVLIPADSLSPENYRRLAVALHTTWQGGRDSR